jgi:hypothetical protein
MAPTPNHLIILNNVNFMIRKLLCATLLITSSLHPYPTINYYPPEEPVTSEDISRLQWRGIGLMCGAGLAGNVAGNIVVDSIKNGMSEERVGFFISWTALAAVLFAAGAYCFDKAEKMY